VTGLLVDRAAPQPLATALRRLIESPELRRRLGSAARAQAEREYAPDVVRHRLMTVYERALAVHAVR
jgi:glycosyltransferase involved in cell wall biosynthesis